jgi:hypothetical protein
MSVSKDILLGRLPPFMNDGIIVEPDQEIHDIIKEVVNAHKVFEKDYDLIYSYFDQGTIKEICKRLFDFCKQNIAYQVESEDLQTTKSPAAILAMGKGDCKHYAGFIAGVLSAINRNTDRGINWRYRFASYSVWDSEVGHVFVVVVDKGKDIWIDPVLSYFDSREVIPVKKIDKKINDQMLKRISGGIGTAQLSDLSDLSGPVTIQSIPFDTSNIANAQTLAVKIPAVAIEPDYYDSTISATLENDIKMLLYYGIIDSNMNIYSDKYLNVLEGLQGQDADDLSNAYGDFLNALQTNVVGNIFSSIWGSVKQVSLSIPRGAYLSLVSLNVFNLAGHLNKCITNPDGTTYQHGIDLLQGVWHGKLSGDTNLLLRAIRNGAQKKAILGVRIGFVAAAWAVTAATIIAAMTPIITSILKGKNSFDTLTAQQLGMQTSAAGLTTSTSQLQQYLPYILLAGVVYYISTSKK